MLKGITGQDHMFYRSTDAIEEAAELSRGPLGTVNPQSTGAFQPNNIAPNSGCDIRKSQQLFQSPCIAAQVVSVSCSVLKGRSQRRKGHAACSRIGSHRVVVVFTSQSWFPGRLDDIIFACDCWRRPPQQAGSAHRTCNKPLSTGNRGDDMVLVWILTRY